MSIDFFQKSSELIAQKKRFAIATVVHVEGSSSARPGSKAIIEQDGTLLGWIGGGCAEGTVRREAAVCLEIGLPQLIRLDMTDEALGVGMPCGGLMDVYIEPVLPKPELLIVGHGRIAETIATLGHMMDFAVTVNDPLADRRSFPDAKTLVTDDFDLSATPIDAQTYVVIATQHKGDHLWLKKAVDAGAAYVALVSSHHRAALVLDYMAAAGVSPVDLSRVWAPAGLDLGAQTPEEIALSIVSQIVALRRGGSCQQSAYSPRKTVTECELTSAGPR
jgi:xanthine dehydrogenase accessory factor